ncbi:MAG: membrane protein insertase YidC [Planctomycetia bacterium]|nr:membrane protein insertase YidC [Planctomycetia bacterium]
MERRYIQFALISFAILLGSQALQAVLFPKKPPVKPAGAPPEMPADAAIAAAGDAPVARGTGDIEPRTDVGGDEPVEVDRVAAPRVRRSLGSLAEGAPARMLVTLTSRGAAVERIELAGRRFHDQDDWSGYLGHLALEATTGGCRVGVVGAGTPAAAAGIEAGDVIARVGAIETPDPAAVLRSLATTKPGQTITVELVRSGSPRAVEATLVRRPLEVVRPEHKTAVVEDPDGLPHDPLSFRLSVESLDGRQRREPLAEIPGLELADRDWELDPTSDASRVRFTTRLPGGLTVAKEYRLVTEPSGEGHGLELDVELATSGRESVVRYALDGPTGLPTEGWWYTARVARDWGSLAVRDVAMRFVGEQSTLVSGLKIADAALDHPATAVRDGKPLSFAGVDALYFAAALIPAAEGPEAPALDEVRPLAVGDIPPAARRKLVDVTCRLVSRQLRLAPDVPVVHRYGIFAGPKQPELLAEFGAEGARMDDLVYYGWFGWVARPMVAILHAIHAVIGNYGLAILLLTVIVRGAMFPISRKQALASQKMQALQPEMKAITEKYKNDPQKRTQATQELWRKHDYNPMGGCLLVFIQIPIFMGLYRSLATDVELRQAPLFSSAIRWCSNLAAPDMFWDWSQVLPQFLTAPEGWLGPFLNLFPLATIGLFLWQQKLFMPPAMDEQAQMQQQVMKYMMFFMALMFFKVPCGLCLYFIASSLWGIAERLLLPTAAPQAALAGAGGGTATRTFDVPFISNGKQKEDAATAARKKRQARKR